jgi:hypothetical protein
LTKRAVGKIAIKSKIDLSPYEVVATADAERNPQCRRQPGRQRQNRRFDERKLHRSIHARSATAREWSADEPPAEPLHADRSAGLFAHHRRQRYRGEHRPDLDQKRDIVQNPIILARQQAFQPKVAVLAAIETVNSDAATARGCAFAKMADRRQIVGGIVDGPLDLDIAVDKEAARIKGVETPVATSRYPHRAQHRSRQHDVQGAHVHGRARATGLVMGARVPVILTSRADTPQSRLFSCALAVLFAASGQGPPRCSTPFSRIN